MAAGSRVTEADIGDKLIEFRSQQPGFIEPSFATIAGAGPNGAIIHYRAEPGSCRDVDVDTLLLLDSGGQYDCGARTAGGERRKDRVPYCGNLFRRFVSWVLYDGLRKSSVVAVLACMIWFIRWSAWLSKSSR